MTGVLLEAPRLYAALVGQQLKATLEYRSDFWIQMAGMALQQLVWFAFVGTMFLHTPAVQGWSFWEIAFLYGMATLSSAVNALLFEGVWRLPALIRMGELDRLLVRPLNPILHVFSLSVGIHGLGNLAVGGVILWQASTRVAVDWGPLSLSYLALAVVCGCLIQASIGLATSSISLFTNDPTTSVPYMVNRLGEYARFPMSLYPNAIAGVLTWVLPFAFVAFVPSAVLLGKQAAWVALGAPLAAVAAFGVARTIFYRGLRRYESTGS